MKIQVLGTGCTKCKVLAQHVTMAITELGITANYEKVEAIEEIMKFGVMSTPALVIDGKVVLAGRTGSMQEIKGLIDKSDSK